MNSITASGTETISSLWLTSPLSQSNNQYIGLEKNELNLVELVENLCTTHILSQNGISRGQPLPKEPNTCIQENTLPVLTLVERIPMVMFDIQDASDSKRIK